ncbi:AsnC family transcriptional regulator [Halobaculum sp. MBLA0143]|uniref:AsnC family transcriptional regulator n=1 Tax=Halobaculum sp. MBLA0143 TaxID=3079933 RepID=UPI003525D098
MRELDETDVVILRLLAADSRRSYSEIGERVDLTPPAVSDRVSRLVDAGVINRFTIDVDHATLREGTPVLVRVTPADDPEAVREPLSSADATEHLFVTADGDVVAFARTATTAVHEWVTEVVDGDAVADVSVDLVADTEWTASVDPAGFAFDCAECGNTVTAEGQSTVVGDELKHFCCESCAAAFRERHARLEAAAADGES